MGYKLGAQRRSDIEPVIDREQAYTGIEIDNRSMPAPYGNGGWNELLGEKLINLSTTSKGKPRLTIWTGELASVTFHHNTYTCWIIVAGDKNLRWTESINGALVNAVGDQFVRFSEDIHGSEVGNWRDAFHVLEGQVWQSVERYVWANCELDVVPRQELAPSTKPNVKSDDSDWLSEAGEDEHEENKNPVVKPVASPKTRTDRKHVAKSNAKIGPLITRLEVELGFPKGSLALVHPDDRTPYKANATVGRVRKDWGNDE